MAAVRLTDGQKAELLERFRQGAGLQELATAFGCSPNTVSRTVKTLVGADAYERLKETRAGLRGGAMAGSDGPSADAVEPGGTASPTPTAADAVEAVAADEEPEDLQAAQPAPGRTRRRRGGLGRAAESAAAEQEANSAAEEEADASEDSPGALAIDDADDFGDDDRDALTDDEEGDGDEGEEAVALRPLADGREIRPLPLAEAQLPAAWMLVDEKTVELQPRPLSDFPELGTLPAEELDRQALSLYVNQRQAKRLCGRSQRVIPIPDPAVFQITAPYLLKREITRVVIEGSLYAVPGS